MHWFRNFLTNHQQRVVVCGTFSSWTHVRSGVPQGTILWPILFLIYVNDTSSYISSSIKMFADDTKVYREITDLENDTSALQTDIVRLGDWATLWQLRFNPEKCETMRITHSRDRSVPSYIMGSRIMPVKYTKDLGILITSDLWWSAQIYAVVHKANRSLGVVYRTLGPSNVEAFSTLYKTLVRPILEYAIPVWCPYLVKDILALEKVQRRASCLALGQRRGDMEYEDRLKILNWPTLEKRYIFTIFLL